MDVFLGIDTSCYTTSLCLVDAAYDVVADERIILSVAKGGRGLSQSNGLSAYAQPAGPL